MKSLHICEAAIIINASKDYKRISTAVCILTAAALLGSGLPWYLAAGLCGFLFFQLAEVLVFAKPSLDIQSLTLKKESWILHSKSSGELEYEKVESLLDTNFFQLLTFSDLNKKSKLIVLFHDQIQPESLYLMRRRLMATHNLKLEE